MLTTHYVCYNYEHHADMENGIIPFRKYVRIVT